MLSVLKLQFFSLFEVQTWFLQDTCVAMISGLVVACRSARWLDLLFLWEGSPALTQRWPSQHAELRMLQSWAGYFAKHRWTLSNRQCLLQYFLVIITPIVNETL